MLPDGTYDLGAETLDELFQMHNGTWDFVIMSDVSSGPANAESRAESLAALVDNYAPIFPPNATALFMVTQTYRGLTMTTQGQDPYVDFLAKTREGYNEYKKALEPLGVKAKVRCCDGQGKTVMYKNTLTLSSLPTFSQQLVDVGQAFLDVFSSYGLDMFSKLYSPDNIHSSTYGAYLQAAIFYCTITGEYPPVLNNEWFEVARYMEFRDRYQLSYEATPFPTAAEAELLRLAAIDACKKQV